MDTEEEVATDVDDTDYKEGASVAELSKSFLPNQRRMMTRPKQPKSLAEMSCIERLKLRRQVQTYFDAKIDDVLPKKS